MQYQQIFPVVKFQIIPRFEEFYFSSLVGPFSLSLLIFETFYNEAWELIIKNEEIPKIW